MASAPSLVGPALALSISSISLLIGAFPASAQQPTAVEGDDRGDEAGAPSEEGEAGEEGEGGEGDVSDEEMDALMQAIGADAAAVEDKAEGADASESTGAPAAEPSAPGPAPAAGAGAIAQGAARVFQSMNPNMSFILDVAGAWFSDGWSFTGPGGVAVGNYQTGAHDPRATGFNLQQLELHVESAVDPFFTMQGNIVFSQFGVEIEEAYATTTSLPWGLQARVGQFLTRFGRKNPTHPHSWHFVDQPLVNGKLFGAEGNRGLGVEMSWLAPLPWYVELLASVNDAAGACCARSFFGGDALPVLTPLDLLYTVGARQFFPLNQDLSLMWGVTAQSGPNPSGKNNRTEIVGTDLYLRYRPVGSPGRTTLAWTTEALVRRTQVPGGVLMDSGFYSQVVWQFWLQYELGARIEGVSGNPADPLDPDWPALRTRTSAQVTYYPSHFSRIRGQVSYGASGSPDMPAWTRLYERPVFAVFFAFEFLVGAHGSHGF